MTKATTKVEMIAEMNGMLQSFYGASTKLASRYTSLPKEAIAELYDVYYYNLGDTLSERVYVFEQNMPHIRERWTA